MLLSRYSNIDYVLNMYWVDAMKLIHKAQEKIVDDKLFFRWVINYEKYESFKDFKDKLMHSTKQDKETAGETLERVEKMMKLFKFEPGGE